MCELFLRFIYAHKDPEFRQALSDRPKAEEMLEWLSHQEDYPGKDAHADVIKQWLEKSERKIREKIGL